MLPIRRQRAIRSGRPAPTGGQAEAVDAAPGSFGKRVKESADTATAIAKALLFFGGLVIVTAVVATILWRDRHARHVEVTIDAAADRALRAMGSQIDLRQTFVDVLNARIRGVEQVFALNFAQLIDTRDAPDVSFKPFGLDASSGEITKIARELTGADPPTAVRVELLCPKANCDDAGARGSTLLVTVVDRDGSVRLAIPIGGVADGLPRRLRDAMRQAADQLLERAEPLIAAVYYLNTGPQHLFPDDGARDQQRSMASALKLRDRNGAVSCIADLIIGGTLFKRGNWEDGLVYERRAASSDDPVCQVHAATNLVFFAAPYLCGDDSMVRAMSLKNASDALDPVVKRGRQGLGDLVADRIPSAQIDLASMNLLASPAMDATRQALCLGQRATSVDAATVERYVASSIDTIEHALPPRPGQRAAQSRIELLAALERLGLPDSAIAARLRTSAAVMKAIEAYLPSDPTPRRLFALRGQLALDMAAAARDGLARDAAERRAILRDLEIGGADPADGDVAAYFQVMLQNRLIQARSDLQNALAAQDNTGIGEAVIDVSLRTLEGDVALLQNDVRSARASYRAAIDEFLAAETPVDRLIDLAAAVARLAALDKQGGGCPRAASGVSDASDRAPVEPAAMRLGLTMADWCALDDPRTAAKPGLVGIVAALVQPSMQTCQVLLSATTPDAHPAFPWVRCLVDHGPATLPVMRTALGERDGATLRATIEESLKGAASGGT